MQDSLRAALRVHTQGIHHTLDETIGAFDDLDSYKKYLVQTYRFRATAEQATADITMWPSLRLTQSLGHDIIDLGLSLPALNSGPLKLVTPSQQIGALYVLEGSSLGARILLKRANALGFDAYDGARHLARQASEPQRWRNFLLLLEEAENIDRAEVLSAAVLMFEVATAAYESDVHLPI